MSHSHEYIAKALDRLSRYYKLCENDVEEYYNDNIPVSIGFTLSGNVIMKYAGTHIDIVKTLEEAAVIINDRLDQANWTE